MKKLFKAMLATTVLCGLSFQASAQNEWPKAKPVTLVVAFAPGSSTDIVARSLTQKLNELTGGNFIVDNKGGAGGNIATAQVKRAPSRWLYGLGSQRCICCKPFFVCRCGIRRPERFCACGLGAQNTQYLHSQSQCVSQNTARAN